MKLSLLIPSITERHYQLGALIDEISKQIERTGTDQVQVVINCDSKIQTIGEKRNWLLQNAGGDYVAFIDEDDMITPVYLSTLLEGIEKGVDCVALRGLITENGQNPQIFEHSIRHKEWRTNSDEEILKTGIRYIRNANHLNCIKREIACQFKFPETNHGEDHDWSKLINASRLLKTEHYTDQILYNYKYIPK